MWIHICLTAGHRQFDCTYPTTAGISTIRDVGKPALVQGSPGL